jgi:hypothetical protein
MLHGGLSGLHAGRWITSADSRSEIAAQVLLDVHGGRPEWTTYSDGM